MKKLILGFSMLALLASCNGGGRGELIGVSPRSDFYQVNPYGMNYIPPGSFSMGPSDQDVPYANNAKTKTVSVQAFYMDDTEISNNEYRQFVYWVKDSIAHTILGDADIGEHLITEDAYGEDLDPPLINWDERIEWDGEEEREELADMFLSEGERFYGRKNIDTRKLKYTYFWIDLKAAASKSGRDLDLSYENSKGQTNAIRGHVDRSKYIIREEINVYPDTLVWISDFTYSFNEPMTESYFWHPAFDDYPLVGVTWAQAKAFNIWRTQLMNNYLKSSGQDMVQRFRLPSEAEWEYASRGGLESNPYPWGGPYTRNIFGCPLANFKPMRGDYIEDGGFHTVEINSYEPNDFGLYCMSGNVAEWTNTAYDESVYDFSHDLNPEYTYDALKNDPPALKRKVTRGGSWKDVKYYIQTGTRTYEYRDTAKSYIGFRSVMSYLGRGKTGNSEDWN
ncbi:MAG: sulfatase modifying factor 1 [Patiriisocius sp.]|jgi:sulfatase modifying factor 1